MQKLRYELDPHNRLVLKSGKKSDLEKFRKVLDGRFKTDENNELSYRVKTPLSKDENIPHQLKLKGEWSLTDNHDLRLTLDKQGRETFGDKVTLQGEILDVNKNSLSFAVTTKTKGNTQSTYILNLGGSWKADKNNRLSFHVKKESGKYDILTFKGAWEISKNHRIIYEYEKAELIRKKRKTHTLIFKGYWDIKDKVRISYILSKDAGSIFNFEASAGILREDYIRYEVGIGSAAGEPPVKRTVRLFGKWKLKKGAGLIFEVEYEDKKTHAIIFGAEAKMTDEDTVIFKLKNDIENKDMGMSVELSHKILKGEGVAFIRLLRSKRESAVYSGAARRW